MSEVEQWLEGLGLACYAPAFAAHRIEFDLLGELADDDLKQLGVEALGHRKRLLRAIALVAGTVASSPVAALAAATDAPHLAHDVQRRQLTVMFCDLVGSTALSSQLDPEDLQQIMVGYHKSVTAAVAPYAGYVARFLGDGALVYFGFPQAHEDDAARAVRAAMDVLAALRVRSGEIVLQARIGIATGLVVVGEVGAGTAAAEHAASGETPNLAARLQAQAHPGEIVVSANTRQLLGHAFALESVGRLDLKGFIAPIEAWRVVSEHRAATRFEAQHMQGPVAFVGRDSELALLMEQWALARDGEGRVVLLVGDAGIGKSRICQRVRERLADESVATALLQCSPYFSASALYPVTQYLERASGVAPGDALEVRAAKLAELAGSLPDAALGCLLRLLGLPDAGRCPPGGAPPEEEKAHTLEALIELLHQLSARQPVLFLVEDAHWIDPTTDELIGQIAQQLPRQRLLLLVTCRPEYAPGWGGTAQLTRLSLDRLSQPQCTDLISAVAGHELPGEVLAEIIRKTDGIPLFVEELTKMVLQSGLLEETAEGYRLAAPLPPLAIPSTLQDSLMARLDQLAQAKQVAQVGAVIGREFRHRLIADVLVDMPASRLDAALTDLVTSELVFRRGTPPDATYSFKHALVRDTAYASMLKRQRVLRHRQVAAALEQSKGETAQHELLAYHHQQGGDAEKAIRHWQAAGDQAMARSAGREAVAHYEATVALLDTVRKTQPCDELELGLRRRFANALWETEGWSTSRMYESSDRARELAVLLDRPDAQLLACTAIAGYFTATGRLGEGIAILDRFEPATLARARPMGRLSRLVRLAQLRMLLGELSVAHRQLDEARCELESVRPEDWQPMGGADPTVNVLLFLSQVSRHQGQLSLAESYACRGLEIAEQRPHAINRARALYVVGSMAAMKGRWHDSIARTTQAVELAQRYGLKTSGASTKFGLGRAWAASGQLDLGLRLLREGYSECAKFGGMTHGTALAAEAAEVLLDAGCTDAAAEFLLAGEKTMRETGERFQAASLLSLRGRLAEIDGDRSAAETAYRGAMEIAELQGALLYVLRAATLLARLLQSLGRADEGHAVLRPIYGRFTEGFDWPDLIRAKTVLESRGSSAGNSTPSENRANR